MKLVRFGKFGSEKPGIIDGDGCIRDISAHIGDWHGPALGKEGIEAARRDDLAALPGVSPDVRLGAPVAGVGNIICIGLNYSDHAAEARMEVPAEPVVFMKSTAAISGPCDDVVLPRNSRHSDWEVELGVVIGDRASYVSEAEALDYVAGYLIVNDLSERVFQMKHCGQWVKGKSCETFAPLGPWLVTRDEVPDPQDLAMTLDVNGHRYQDGSTRTMVFPVPFLVSYLSRFMPLLPGDIISTGTPPGVGFAQDPPVFLRAGDEMVLRIEKLGEQRQSVVAPR